MTTEFEILHALRVKGLAAPATLGALSGVPLADLPGACDALAVDGLLTLREGRFGGYLLTAAGRARADADLAADGASQAARPAVQEFDAAFLPVNGAFKQLCHRWQVTPDDAPNDHTDPTYDGAVVADLRELHGRLVPLLDSVAVALPRLGRYEARLDDALRRVESGDTAAFARPMHDSYHDIWMELHNDVVLTLARERTGADEG